MSLIAEAAGGVLDNKLVVAILTAALGFLSAYALFRLNRKADHLVLTYGMTIVSSSLALPDDIVKDVYLTYQGQAVPDLQAITIEITNEGDKGIRHHNLRFTAPPQGRFLRFEPEKAPSPEIGYRQLDAGEIERRVSLNYLAPEDRIRLVAVTSGGDWSNWSDIGSLNDENDVSFRRRDVSRQIQDAEHLLPFLQASLGVVLLTLLSLTLNPVAGPLTSAVAAVLYVALGAVLFRHIRPIARLLQRPAERTEIRQGTQFFIETVSGENHHFGDRHTKHGDSAE